MILKGSKILNFNLLFTFALIFFKVMKVENLNPKEFIILKGVRCNNLKNIDVAIPRNKFVVITGVSGSGKSSLAFDTLYAEGQRRYVESLSSYARQFLGKLDKPQVDYIKGISPAIAIEQKVNTSNPRSTVGTSSEVYDYLKILFARIGKTISPISGNQVKKHKVSDIIEFIKKQELGSMMILGCNINLKENETFNSKVQVLKEQGFQRIKINGEIQKIEEILSFGIEYNIKLFDLIIDRFQISYREDFLHRIADSIQIAFFEGLGKCFLEKENGDVESFSDKFELDGISFDEPSELLFNFNGGIGACTRCEGFGYALGIDENLVIPNKNLSVYENCVACWNGEKMNLWKKELMDNAILFDFPVHMPYKDLTEKQKEVLWNGNEYFKGINSFFEMLENGIYKMHYRIILSKYRGRTICPKCNGGRLKEEAYYVKIHNKSIKELSNMSINDLQIFFKELKLDKYDYTISERLILEINNRLEFLCNVGLGYLTLNRNSSSLSGGESQRINLATSLGSSLIGSMYILDEPSIGLHSKDSERLISVLKKLRDLGNTVIVVEHDEDIINSADYVIDIGRFAGNFGGEVVFQGTLKDMKGKDTLTSKYLFRKDRINNKNIRISNNFVYVKGAKKNNLKNIDVKIPLNCLVSVTGVSGSGKSTLINDILYPALNRIINKEGEDSKEYDKIEFDRLIINNIEYISQNPIGRSSRSIPISYTNAYDDIRNLLAEQKTAKINSIKAGYFSFNTDGGRCENCKGEGLVTIEMQFMADVKIVCEECEGKRFKEHILDVKFNEKNIHDILCMSVDESIEFFEKYNQKKILFKLKPLQDVGLGYISLGQSSSTLSGGEAQRLKLASFLEKGNKKNGTLFLFDEPTTGLHFYDVEILLKVFNRLIENGNSIVVIEHNLDVVGNSDYIIDLGKDGGEKGGNLVFEGLPRDIVNCKESYTGMYLKNYF